MAMARKERKEKTSKWPWPEKKRLANGHGQKRKKRKDYALWATKATKAATPRALMKRLHCFVVNFVVNYFASTGQAFG